MACAAGWLGPEERKDLSHAKPQAIGPHVGFLEGVGPEATAGTDGKGPSPVALTSFFFNHGKEVPWPQTIFSTFVGKGAFSVPELK